MNYGNKVGFGVGTGRSGTTFLARIMGLVQGVASAHERNPLNETFHRYCKWYNISVDHEGFLYTKQQEINRDLSSHHFSFESSAYLSFSITELYHRFHAKFILLVRRPDRVVNSYLRKGWYQQPVIIDNPELPAGYQQCEEFHHFLGRTLPVGPELLRWQQMTRVGKLAWSWSTLNAKVLKQFIEMPSSCCRVEKLEQLSYNRYLELLDFFRLRPSITRAVYEELVASRPNAFDSVPSIAEWTEAERNEFETEVHSVANRLGYTFRIDDLLNGGNSELTK